MKSRISTKSESQRQDEWSKSRVKPAPNQKPPRYDKRRKHYEEKDKDLEKPEDKDLSMKNASLLESAICQISLQHRGITPDYRDVLIIKASVKGDINSPKFWPRLAQATFEHLDSRYKRATARRIYPTKDHRSFEQIDPLPPRLEGGNWPKWDNELSLRPSQINNADCDLLVTEASKIIDKEVMAYNSEVALRKALDETIWSYNNGKYQGVIDAPNYLLLLNRLSKENIGTYGFESEGFEKVTSNFNPEEYWGSPSNSHIDSGTTKEEKWRKLFEYGGVYVHDEDEPYMKEFFNPNL